MESSSLNSKLPTIKVNPLIVKTLQGLREDMKENPYILEALKVLPVGGYRSAIGSFWNAVVDDLRNKIIHRSLSMFNKSMELRREIKTYEGFQDYVNDDELIEGAFKIGVIGWEASKILKHSKETRHIFDGHPSSSEPSSIKVLAMIEDCIKYVLNEEYPPQIVDIDEYISLLGEASFDRSEISAENALADLPEIYKKELIHRLFKSYIHIDASTIFKSNVEFVAPILWNVLPKAIKMQVVRGIDSVITESNRDKIEQAFNFVKLVEGVRYLSVTARKYKTKPIIENLKNSLDDWDIENKCVSELLSYAPYIPDDLISDYVCALTHTYVGRIGSSRHFARTDFYADRAATNIPEMIEAFDDNAAIAFVECVSHSEILRPRIRYAQKMRRLRNLGHLVMEKVSSNFEEIHFLELLIDESKEKEFFKLLDKIKI